MKMGSLLGAAARSTVADDGGVGDYRHEHRSENVTGTVFHMGRILCEIQEPTPYLRNRSPDFS